MTRNLPDGWRRVRLGEFVQERPEFIGVRDGHSYRRITLQLRNQGIKLRDEVRGQELRTKKQRVVRPGDLVVAEIDAKVGGFGIAPPEADGAIVSSHYYLFSVDQTICDIGYLGACIRKGLLSRQVFAVGSTNYAAIRSRDVLDYRVPLPPMSEQKRIADALRVMDEAIRANEEVLERTRQFKKALAHELLTRGLPGRHTRFKPSPLGPLPAEWEVERLGEVARYSAFGPRFEGGLYDVGGNVACLRTTDISVDGTIDYSSVPKARLDEEKFRPHFLSSGDLVVTRSGTCGIAAIFTSQDLPTVAGAFLIRVALGDSGEPEFVRDWINSPMGQISIRQIAYGGVQKNISGTSLNSVRIPVPPRYEQCLIVGAIRAVSEVGTSAREACERTIAYRDNIRDALLGGGLGVHQA